MRYRIRHFATLRSTNDLALELARGGKPEGLVITADYQTHGRGRGKRKWISPRGKNLLFSVLVRPPVKAHQAPFLTHLAALTVKEILTDQYPQLRVKLKKPNDVMANGKKICGILVESSTKNGCLDYAVVGFGLNVNGRMSSKIMKSTSIFEEIRRKSKINTIFERMLARFSEN